MPPSLLKGRTKTPSVVAANETMPAPPACPHASADTLILNDSLREAAAWCRRCGSLCRPFRARGVDDPTWEAPLQPAATQPVLATPPLAPHIAALIAANQGIFLDVGCSDHKSAGSIGMDIRAVAGVDIVHDLEVFPWPLPDGCAKRILCSHLIEHIKPWLTVQFISECWRVMQVNGQLMIATPYAGSPRFWQDPTHMHGWMEATACYFTPGHPLYDVYRPKPWKLELNEWASVGDLNVILAKLPEEGTA